MGWNAGELTGIEIGKFTGKDAYEQV